MSSSNVLYPEEAVIAMLMTAYKAGFEGPLELSEGICHEILAKGTYKDSDLEVIEFMQQRERKKSYDAGVEARRKATRRTTEAAAGNLAPAQFPGDDELDV